jgi:hypothetical protein
VVSCKSSVLASSLVLGPLGPFAGIITHLYLDDVLIYDCTDTIPPPEPQFDFSLKLYPNPGRDWFELEYVLPAAGKIRIHATDMFGRMVMSRTELIGEKGINTYEIDGSTWASGQYHLSVLYEANGRSAYRHMKVQVVR